MASSITDGVRGGKNRLTAFAEKAVVAKAIIVRIIARNHSPQSSPAVMIATGSKWLCAGSICAGQGDIVLHAAQEIQQCVTLRLAEAG